MRELLEGS